MLTDGPEARLIESISSIQSVKAGGNNKRIEASDIPFPSLSVQVKHTY